MIIKLINWLIKIICRLSVCSLPKVTVISSIILTAASSRDQTVVFTAMYCGTCSLNSFIAAVVYISTSPKELQLPKFLRVPEHDVFVAHRGIAGLCLTGG